MTEYLQRLAAAHIQLLPATEITTHFVFERDGFVALVERTPQGFGNIGSAGRLTGKGIAVLVWRDERPFFVAKGFEQQATPGEVEQLRRFSTDVETALGKP